MSKIENIFDLSRQTALDLSNGEWSKFLRTAAWTFKYAFPNQLLIYAQKPDVMACATVETWNNILHRRRVPDSTGIALLEDGGDYIRLNYVYDVSDTFSPTDTPFYLWRMTPAKEDAVRAVLQDSYFDDRQAPASNVSLQEYFLAVADAMVDEQCEETIVNLLNIRETAERGDPLLDLDRDLLELRFRELLVNSIAAVMLYRCDIEPDFSDFSFVIAHLFRNPEAMGILGQTTQWLSSQALNIVARAVRSWDKTHKEEIQYVHDNQLREGRGLQNSGIGDPESTAPESLRETEEAVSTGTSAAPLHSSSDDRRADDSFGSSGEHSGSADQDAAERATDSEPGAGENSGQHGLDATHDENSPESGGNRSDGADLRLISDLPDAYEVGLEVDLPTSEDEAAAVFAASSSATLPLEEIDSILTNASERAVPFEMLSAIFREGPGTEVAAKALQEVYGALVFDHVFPDGSEARITGMPYGLVVAKGEETSVLNWDVLSSRLQYLVDNERYHTSDPLLLPTDSSQLQVGQMLLLQGMKYQVLALGDKTVSLQDVEHPIFTQSISRSVLDVLLRPKSQPAASVSVPVMEEAPQPVNAATAVQNETESVQDAGVPEEDYSRYSISMLRNSIAAIFRNNYKEFLDAAGRENQLPDEDELQVILDDFTIEADRYSGELSEAQEQLLRTMGNNGKALAATAFRMRSEGLAEDEMTFVVQALASMYQLDEKALYAIAETSDWIQINKSDLPKQEPNIPPPLTAGYTPSPAKRNYKFLEKYAPEILNGSLDYIRFESDTYEPLYIERIGPAMFAMAHTYSQNGNLMYDPEITFCLDADNRAFYPVTYEQSYPPIYQEIYSSSDSLHQTPNKRLERDINSFVGHWTKNLQWQDHVPVFGKKYDAKTGDKEYSFDENRSLILKEDDDGRNLSSLDSYIDDVLLRGSGTEDGKLVIYRHFLRDEGTESNSSFLKQEFGIGGGGVILPGGVNLWENHDARGLEIRRSVSSPDRVQISWSQAASRIQALIEEGRYLNAEELARYNAEAAFEPVHTPEPLYDHPEQRRRDLSRDFRKDKLVLVDLLMHFDDYRVSYSLRMPELSEHDQESYEQEYTAISNMSASSDPEENKSRILSVMAFYKRWFVPFVEEMSDKIQSGMYDVLSAAEEVINNWDRLDLGVDVLEQDPNVNSIGTGEYNAESFHPGDYYEDANGRGIIVTVSPERYEGNHAAMFSYADPDAKPGSRAAKGFVMDMEAAIDRLNHGEATLIPAAQWQELQDSIPTKTVDVAETEEPTLFDFSFDEPTSFPEEAPAPVRVNAEPEVAPSDRINYKIPAIAEDYGGPKARFQNNLAAIRLLKDLEANGRLASSEEQKVLAKYVGWGGLPQAFDENNSSWRQEYAQLKEVLTKEEYESARSSTLTAFYTPPEVTEAIYNGLRQLGYRRGNILDPCCGTGNFFGMLPEDMGESRLYGVELDDISGRISRQLYQNANIIIDGYEKTDLPDSTFDVAIGNVPFGNFSLADRRYDKERFLIHDYFFAKTLDKVRPGGIIAFVTSKGTMDKQNDSVRRYIAQRADLLGAIRLPDNVFSGNAGTDAVADILFLRKREHPAIETPYWVGLDRNYLGYDAENNQDKWGPDMNAYFVDNPDMVLGDMVEVSGPHGPVWTCKAREGEGLRESLNKALQNIEGQIGATQLDVDFDSLDTMEQSNSIPADPSVRNFSFTVVDGDIYFREDSVMNRVTLNKTAERRVKGLVKLRDITRALIAAQVENAPDAAIRALQDELNKEYDSFTVKYGRINNRGNSIAFSDDSSYYLLCSLENIDQEGNFLGKADMFYKRTIGRYDPVEHVETADEALAASIGELARVDLDYMSDLSGISKEDLLRDLNGIIFLVPGTDNRYELSNIYLSGNVRKKLQEAQEAAKDDPRFNVNVAHLQEAIPEDLSPAAISVRLGATWIPKEDYFDFIFEILELDDFYRRHKTIDIIYSDATDRWSIKGKNNIWSVKATKEYGTKNLNALEILEASLNLKDVQVFDSVRDSDGNTRRVLNMDETIAAQEKQQLLKETFKDWIWKDPDRRERLCREYNDRFNSIVPPSYNGNMVRFHGMNPSVELEDHQKEGIARILYGGNTLLAHVVGAGKTWTMGAAAMEGKHLGLFHKSMIAVPNHLVGQWAAAIYELYPQANVLASTLKDFQPANRKKFCSRIATGDYDIIIIGHSQFEKIPLSVERQEAMLIEQRDDIIDSILETKAEQGESFTIKELERAKKTLEARIEKLQNAKKRDDVITFEELGIDRLFVDESHNYKNLFLYSKMTNVAGISQTDSQKASDLFMKCRYMDEITGNKGNIHATGTPVSNTMAEVYTTQRYLQYDVLQEMGLGSFDAWASTFGETVVSLELAPEGNGYRPRTRFAKFFNLPELLNLYKQVADIRTKDTLNLPLPDVTYETVALKPSEEQRALVKELGDRAEKIRSGSVKSNEDNMLCITNDGRKLALDQRLIDPDLPDNPNSKAAACAEKIYKLYTDGEDKKLTQLVFCDISTPKSDGSFNVYEDLKEKLIAKGIPADEIRFIHEANTEAQKEALFEKVRAGEVRVLMGSTGKMGTGTNVQNRLIAGHDLDVPWRPSDLEQRAGRVERRGNENDQVYMVRYVTEDTFDAYSYQLLEAKQRFISQIFTSKDPVREANDVDDATLSFSEIKALASGNPKIREKVALEIEVAKLEMLYKRHKEEQFELDYQVNRSIPKRLKEERDMQSVYESDQATVSSHPSKTTDGTMNPIVVNGASYDAAGKAGDAILKALGDIKDRDEWEDLGTFRGFRVRGMLQEKEDFLGNITLRRVLALKGSRTYIVGDELESGVGTVRRLDNILDKHIPHCLEDTSNRISRLEHDLKSAEQRIGLEFPKQQELQEKRARLAELDHELNVEAQKDDGKSVHFDPDISPEGCEVVTDSPTKPSLASMIASADERSKSFAGPVPDSYENEVAPQR